MKNKFNSQEKLNNITFLLSDLDLEIEKLSNEISKLTNLRTKKKREYKNLNTEMFNLIRSGSILRR